MELTPRLEALLDRLKSLVGPVAVQQIADEGPEVIYARLETLAAHEASIADHLTRELAGVSASSMLNPRPEGLYRPKPLVVNVQTFDGKEGENLLLWVRGSKRP